MDRILFGDNQFFGVNHMSEEKAREQAMRFPERRRQSLTSSILPTIEGIRTFMCTTQDRIVDLVVEHLRANSERYAEVQVLSVHALCPQICECRDRRRDRGRDAAFFTQQQQDFAPSGKVACLSPNVTSKALRSC